jgi:hypothetical protein
MGGIKSGFRSMSDRKELKKLYMVKPINLLLDFFLISNLKYIALGQREKRCEDY